MLPNKDISNKKGAAAQILTTNFEKFNTCKTKEDVITLCHQLFDEAGLDTPWTKQFFYNLDRQPNYASAMIYMNNARMAGSGLSMKRGARQFYENDEINESMSADEKAEFMKKLRKGEVKFKYMKKDGSEREAKGTMDPKLMNLPEKKTQANVDSAEKKQVRKLPEDSVFYYDLDAKGFRSFKMSNFIEYV